MNNFLQKQQFSFSSYKNDENILIQKKQSSFNFVSRKSSLEFFQNSIKDNNNNNNNNNISIQNDEYINQFFQNNFEQNNTENFEIENEISGNIMSNQIESFSSSQLNKVNPLNMNLIEEQQVFGSKTKEDGEEEEAASNFSMFTLSNKISSSNKIQQKSNNKKINNTREENFFKIQKSSKQIKKVQKIRKNYDKNICRYLTRKAIRCFAKAEYKKQTLGFANGDEEALFKSSEYFLRKIEYITGFRVLKEYLNFEEETDEDIRIYKQIFRNFFEWFLKNRMARYIMTGEMEDKQMYINYKNNVMLEYFNSLDQWTSNKNRKKIEKKLAQMKNQK